MSMPDHYEYEKEPTMAILTATTHHWDIGSDRYTVEFHFSDGKVFTDKLLRGASRQVLANHFQQWADAMRVMESAVPDPPAEVE